MHLINNISVKSEIDVPMHDFYQFVKVVDEQGNTITKKVKIDQSLNLGDMEDYKLSALLKAGVPLDHVKPNFDSKLRTQDIGEKFLNQLSQEEPQNVE